MEISSRQQGPVLRRKLDDRRGLPIGRLIGLFVMASVCLGAVGLVVASAVPSIDLLGLYAARAARVAAEEETPKVKASDLPTVSTPREKAPAIAPPPNREPEEKPTAEVNPTDGSGESEKPKPAGPRVAERDISLLDDLPRGADLPAVTEVGESKLSYLHEANQIHFDDVSLHGELAQLEPGHRFHLQRDGKKPRWTIHLARPGADAAAGVVLADLWGADSALMFQWREAAAQTPAAEQLRNAALKFSIGKTHRILALRKAVTALIYKLDLSQRTSEIECAIAHPPLPQNLHMEIAGADHLPVNGFYKLEKRRTPVPRETAEQAASTSKAKTPAKTPPAKSPAGKPAGQAEATPPFDPNANEEFRVSVLFDKLSTGEEPQLWFEPRSNDAGVTIRVSPVLIRGKIREDLTPKSLELFRLPRDGRVATVERDWKNLHDEQVLLDRRIGELKTNPGKSAAEVVNARGEIKRMQARLPIVKKEYQKLDEELKRLKKELAWVAAAERLMQSIDKQAQLQYRIFAKSGDLEIDLVRGGMD